MNRHPHFFGRLTGPSLECNTKGALVSIAEEEGNLLDGELVLTDILLGKAAAQLLVNLAIAV